VRTGTSSLQLLPQTGGQRGHGLQWRKFRWSPIDLEQAVCSTARQQVNEHVSDVRPPGLPLVHDRHGVLVVVELEARSSPAMTWQKTHGTRPCWQGTHTDSGDSPRPQNLSRDPRWIPPSSRGDDRT